MEFKYYLKIICRRKWIFLLILLSTICLPLILSLFNKDIYKVSSRVIINKNDIQARFLDSLPNVIGELQFLDSDNYYESFLELIKDHSCLNKVIDDLHINVELDSFCTDFPYLKFMSFLQDTAVSVKQIEDSDIYEINGYSPSPKEAENIANRLVDAFLKHFHRINQKIARNVEIFLEKNRKRIETELAAIEQKKEEFIAREGITSFDTQLSEFYKELNTYEYDLHSVKVELKSLDKTQHSIEKALDNIPVFQKSKETVSLDPTINKVKTQLAELMESLAGSETELSPEHLEIIKLKNQIKTVKEFLKTEKIKYYSSEEIERNEYYDDLVGRYCDNDINKISNQINLNLTKEKIDSKKAEIMRVTKKNVQYSRIDDEISRLRDNWKSNMNAIESARLLQQMEIANATIIRYADSQIDGLEPYFPSRKKIVFLGGFLGLSFAFFFTLFLEYLDETCKSADEVRRLLNFPVVSSIPKIKGFQLRLALSENKFYRKLSESFWILWSALKLSEVKRKQQIIAITSSIPGEGKTTTSVFLARTFAESGGKVLLMETNMKRPILDNISPVEIHGTLDLLLDDQTSLEMVATEISPNLHIIASRKVDSAAKLLCSQQMSILFQNLKQESDYDQIIVELPSLDDDNSALFLSNYVDVVIMVVGLGKVKCPALKRSFDELIANKKDRQIKIVTNMES